MPGQPGSSLDEEDQSQRLYGVASTQAASPKTTATSPDHGHGRLMVWPVEDAQRGSGWSSPVPLPTFERRSSDNHSLATAAKERGETSFAGWTPSLHAESSFQQGAVDFVREMQRQAAVGRETLRHRQTLGYTRGQQAHLYANGHGRVSPSYAPSPVPHLRNPSPRPPSPSPVYGGVGVYREASGAARDVGRAPSPPQFAPRDVRRSVSPPAFRTGQERGNR